jgi:signal transduction histidine kinase
MSIIEVEDLRQRVVGLQGTLAVESEPGAGTAISVSVPA